MDGGLGDDTFVVDGTNALKDAIIGGDGDDTILVSGASALSLNRFNAQDQSIENWLGNGAAVFGTKSANVFDFSGLNSVNGLAYIDAGKGNDMITGTDFADDIRGGVGNDLITGGAGDDVLNGGGGNDIFVFGAGFDHDTITGFAAGLTVGDAIKFEGLFADYDSVLAASQQVGANVVITVSPSDTITLTQVALSNLAANDFLFA